MSSYSVLSRFVTVACRGLDFPGVIITGELIDSTETRQTVHLLTFSALAVLSHTLLNGISGAFRSTILFASSSNNILADNIIFLD